MIDASRLSKGDRYLYENAEAPAWGGVVHVQRTGDAAADKLAAAMLAFARPTTAFAPPLRRVLVRTSPSDPGTIYVNPNLLPEGAEQ